MEMSSFLSDSRSAEMAEYPCNGHSIEMKSRRESQDLHSCKMLKCWTAFKAIAIFLSLCTLSAMFMGGKFCVPDQMPEVCGFFELNWYASEHLLCMEGVCSVQSKVPYSQLYLIMVGLSTLLVIIGQSVYLIAIRVKDKKVNVQNLVSVYLKKAKKNI